MKTQVCQTSIHYEESSRKRWVHFTSSRAKPPSACLKRHKEQAPLSLLPPLSTFPPRSLLPPHLWLLSSLSQVGMWDTIDLFKMYICLYIPQFCINVLFYWLLYKKAVSMCFCQPLLLMKTLMAEKGHIHSQAFTNLQTLAKHRSRSKYIKPMLRRKQVPGA